MPLQYFEKWAHTCHTDSIDCVAFSVDGVFLASGSMDGTVVICNAACGTVLHIIHCRSGVLALKWAPIRLHEVWCGLGDGRLLCIIIGKTKIQTLCFRAHKYPIEHLAFDRSGLKLATGAQQELKVWRYLAPDRLRHVNDLSPPGAASLTAQEPTLVTSLHWLHSGDDAGCLLMTYLYQGIR
ncbi:WD40-repeat-containing domain protein [Suillus occidentalis]|nr:WD40-repeat-containing domain protein [Suillus occidentalis]